MPRQSGRKLAVTFWALWLFIIFVSVVDGYLAIRNRQHLLEFELNPLGRALVAHCGGVACLVAAKFLGTIIACSLLLLLWRANSRWTLLVVSLLAGLQLALLLFLVLA
jgi:hypothetical protein